MRTLVCVCLLSLLSFPVSVSAQGGRTPVFGGGGPLPFLDPLLSKLDSVKFLSNYDRGFGGTNEFYQLSRLFLTERRADDFKQMLDDRNPVVRAMGLLCLAQVDAERYRALLSSHTTDREYVYLHQGCDSSMITLGEFAERLLKDPFFLNDPNSFMEKPNRDPSAQQTHSPARD